jgi:hypothetical protein
LGVRDNQLAAAAAGGLEVAISAMCTHASDMNVQAAGVYTLCALVAHMPAIQTRAGALDGVEAMVAALRLAWGAAAALAAEERAPLRRFFFERWCDAMSWLLHHHPINKHKAVAAGAIELLVAHVCAPAAAGAEVLDSCCNTLAHLVIGAGRDARAITAGVMEALEARRAESPAAETARLELMRHLQPAAQRHDAAPCAVAGCKRCGAARERGTMCALAGCGARGRPGGKKLLRCGTCRAACYCSAAHQREDWGRHKGECRAPPRDHNKQAAGASGR